MRRLYRSNEHKIIGGVSGGLGEHFDIDPTWIRLTFVLLTLAHGIGIVAYIVAWIIIPREDTVIVRSDTPAAPNGEVRSQPVKSTTSSGSLLPGIIMICIGALFLIHETFWWFSFHMVWPLVLIAIGGVLIYRSIEGKREEEKEPEVVNESS